MEEKQWKDRKEGKTRGLEKRVNQKEEKRERLGEGEDLEMWGKGGWMRGGRGLKEGRIKCSDRRMCEMIHKLFGVE